MYTDDTQATPVVFPCTCPAAYAFVVALVAAQSKEARRIWAVADALPMQERVAAELPFMATENIMMEAVKAGGDRQELHEAIRVNSMEAARMIKTEGRDNDLLDRLKADPAFARVADKIDSLVDPRKFVGRAPEQTEEFIREHISPILAMYDYELTGASVDSVNV